MLLRPASKHTWRRITPAAVTTLWLMSSVATVPAQSPATPSKPAPAAPPAWVARSNAHAQVLINVLARFNPETAAQLGVEGLDTEIIDLKPQVYRRSRKALTEAADELRKRLKDETHPAVRQDIELSIQAAERFILGADLHHNYEIPYFNPVETIFQGIRALLDEQVDVSRHPAALTRLERYTGLEDGYKPLVDLATDRTREAMVSRTLLGPPKRQVEKDLGNAPRFIEGLGKLFQAYGITGYEPAFKALKRQLADYERFVRDEVLPRARTGFRQPSELYTFSLKQSGIDMPLDQLVSRAHVSFEEIQEQMQSLAQLVAKEKGWSVSDYRDVIRKLKKNQILGEAILPHYKQRIKEIEAIIERERIVSLPQRPVRMRLASEAESASTPAPHMRPPRMLGNTGERGEFVLPLRIPSEDASKTVAFDDFTFAAGSWTLTAHEARPGHELQFASMVERGISIPRALFAMNSVNAEGWALYAEWEMKPYLPLDGQLISLQHRLLRAARAFLDPGIQQGTITPDEARRVLIDDVVLSEPMAMQEVERYMFWAPGQAPSYFCGYTRLLELRNETELALGDKFDRQAFNDFILSQGMLPPSLIRQAVMTEFIPSRKRAKP